MKILTFSDIIKWKGYEELVNKIKPDVVILAGDLTSDGFASFWNEAIEQIPAYQKELRKMNIKFTRNKNFVIYKWIDNKKPKEFRNENILDVVEAVKEKYKRGKEFLEIRKRTHVDKFYQFLEFAGKKSQVLVVKGDHDEDFEGDYQSEKINKISGCREISSKLIEINDLSLLGLGFNETHYLRIFKPIIEEFKGKVDVVVTHCEQNKMPLVSLLMPKIIIRGHFGSGKYLVNNIPAVFTQGTYYTIIEIKKRNISKILQYTIGSDRKVKILKKGSCRPWLSKISEYERYKWLKPYSS